MSFVSQGLASLIVASAVYIPVNAILSDPPFLRVVEISATDGGAGVYVVREIPGPDGIADWRVTVVAESDDAPACATIPGPRLHEGWSDYTTAESYVQTMTLDVWVGDPGCFDRLQPGPHTEYVTWTPRDGRDPVTHTRTFTK